MGKRPATRIAREYTGDEAWRAEAACRGIDPNFFFPSDTASVNAAKEFCQSCDVREDCLEYSLSHDEVFGVWGGTSERERRRILKAKKFKSVKT